MPREITIQTDRSRAHKPKDKNQEVQTRIRVEGNLTTTMELEETRINEEEERKSNLHRKHKRKLTKFDKPRTTITLRKTFSTFCNNKALTKTVLSKY